MQRCSSDIENAASASNMARKVALSARSNNAFVLHPPSYFSLSLFEGFAGLSGFEVERLLAIIVRLAPHVETISQPSPVRM